MEAAGAAAPHRSSARWPPQHPQRETETLGRRLCERKTVHERRSGRLPAPNDAQCLPSQLFDQMSTSTADDAVGTGNLGYAIASKLSVNIFSSAVDLRLTSFLPVARLSRSRSRKVKTVKHHQENGHDTVPHCLLGSEVASHHSGPVEAGVNDGHSVPQRCVGVLVQRFHSQGG